MGFNSSKFFVFVQLFIMAITQCIRNNFYCPTIESYNCPVPIPDQNGPYAYSDLFVRTKVLPLIGASYAENCVGLQKCLNNNVFGITLIKRYEVECDALKHTCSGYLAISPHDRAIVLVYRGSSVPQYLYENLFFATYIQRDFEGGGKILNYWHDAFYSLWNGGINGGLQNLIQQYPDYDLWIFGHSLGGVLASLSSMVVVSNGIFPAEKLKYISFGEPRIGNVLFAQRFDALVWYPNKMLPCDTYIICEGAEDPRCSDSGLDLTANTHLEYFGIDLLNWHKSGCANSCNLCQK